MTAPWLAPDGREWFAPVRERCTPHPERQMFKSGTYLVHTKTAMAVRFLCASHRVGPIGKAALWALM